MGPLLGGAGESTRVHGQHCPPLSDICGHNGHHWDENLPLCIAASYRSALYTDLCVVLRLQVSCVVFFACFAVLFCPYVSLVRRSAPLVLVCSAFMSTVVFCFAVLSTTCFLCSVFLCSVLLCSASTCLLSSPRPCADQVTLPELSNHLSHSAATCRELQLNLKSSNM